MTADGFIPAHDPEVLVCAHQRALPRAASNRESGESVEPSISDRFVGVFSVVATTNTVRDSNPGPPGVGSPSRDSGNSFPTPFRGYGVLTYPLILSLLDTNTDPEIFGFQPSHNIQRCRGKLSST